MTRFVIVGSYPQSVPAFRGDLIRSLVRAGCDVTVMTADADADTVERIRELGVRFASYSVKRNSIDPRSDLITLKELHQRFREMRHDRILAYTIKPVIWGGIAARRYPRARFFAMITGLGYAFQGESVKRRLLNAGVIRLYRFALRRAAGVIFQNSDNRDLFVRLRIVPADKCHVVSGSGVNLDEFISHPFSEAPAHFLLIARLLGEKGIREYVDAARTIQSRYPDAVFSLVGPEDPSPDGIALAEVDQWHREGSINYLGSVQDVRPLIANAHIYVLPSYHEGMPRTVLEAMAMGRPILTTDVSGCKETVVPGQNGWLVPPRDAAALAERMIWFIENRDQWAAMGTESRRMAEERFDVRKVNAQMLEIMGITQPQTE